jgi:hypothetical protein
LLLLLVLFKKFLMLLIVILITFVAAAIFSDIPQVLLSKLTAKGKQKDFVTMYRNKQRPTTSGMWFVNSVVQSFRQGYEEYIKPALKQRQGKAY